jgi:hypothetical protein
MPGSPIIAWTSHRGRTDEFAPVEAGTATLTMENRTGDFDPTNTSSPYYGTLLPLTQTKINVKHPLDTSYHDIFTGYIEEFDYARQGPRGSIATVPLTDGFELLNNAHVKATSKGSFFEEQHVDARIHAALDDVGWPGGLRRIATGNVNVQSMSYDVGTSLLTPIQEAADAEFPNVASFFMSKAGYAQFNGRFIRFNPTSYPDRVQFWSVGDDIARTEDPSLLPVFDMGWTFSKAEVYNDVIIAPRLTGGDSYTSLAANYVKNQSSIDRYGRRSLSILDLMTLDGSTSGLSGLQECKNFGLYYVNNYNVPRQRIASIEFHGQMDDGLSSLNGALWDFILNVELGHVVNVTTYNPSTARALVDSRVNADVIAADGGGFESLDYFVEGITNNVSSLNDKIPKWSMSLDLSPRARFPPLGFE